MGGTRDGMDQICNQKIKNNINVVMSGVDEDWAFGS
jgi:hypothetical protein